MELRVGKTPARRPHTVQHNKQHRKDTFMPSFSSDLWALLAVEMVWQAARRIELLNRTPSRGAEFVNEYQDASILSDMETERAILKTLYKRKVAATFLSEESLKEGTAPVLKPSGPRYANGQKVYVVVDPLDGSALFRHNIRAWWYSCVGIYSEEGEPLAGAIFEMNVRDLFWCDRAGAYQGILLKNGSVQAARPLKPSAITELGRACLETYTMKPACFDEAARLLWPLMKECECYVPNGGPGGFCDCAAAVADLYVQLDLPLTESFSGGQAIAEKAGCRVSDFKGRSIPFDPDPGKRYTVICSANERLHELALPLLG
ncbi:MAG: hypothetical protein IT210_08475 [Armatimonadetes bacterium]|nr:hypothetical protein [Armatimonadota bacterium]